MNSKWARFQIAFGLFIVEYFIIVWHYQTQIYSIGDHLSHSIKCHSFHAHSYQYDFVRSVTAMISKNRCKIHTIFIHNECIYSAMCEIIKFKCWRRSRFEKKWQYFLVWLIETSTSHFMHRNCITNEILFKILLKMIFWTKSVFFGPNVYEIIRNFQMEN